MIINSSSNLISPSFSRRVFLISHPLFPPKPREHPYSYSYHDPPYHVIPEAPFDFRHVLEVHPVYPHDECQRDENGRDNREHFHDLVHAV